MKKIQNIKVIGGRGNWCKDVVKDMVGDFNKLGLNGEIHCYYPARTISLFFNSDEDMNFYKLCGYFKNSASFVHYRGMFLGRIEFFINKQRKVRFYANCKS